MIDIKTNAKNVFIYWIGKEYKLIKILRDLIVGHSCGGKNYTVFQINDMNVSEYIDQNDIPECYDKLLPAHKADFIRVNVICRYGGIWLDSDTLVMNDMTSLFNLIESKNGFFIRENNNALCNGIFGSIARTPLMELWKTECNNILSLKENYISWMELGNDMLSSIMDKSPGYFQDYHILNGLANIYPINYDKCVEQYIDTEFDNYKKIIKHCQPVIVMVNSVYRRYEESEDPENERFPINYFIRKSRQNIGKDIVERFTEIDFDTYFLFRKTNSIQIIETKQKRLINNDIYYGVYFLEYISNSIYIAYIKNVSMFNDYFSTIYGSQYDLMNIDDYNKVLDRMLQRCIMHELAIFMYYSLMSHIFFTTKTEIKKYRIYKSVIFDILLKRLPSNIFNTIGDLYGCLNFNLSYYFIYQGTHNADLYRKICKINKKICTGLRKYQQPIPINKNKKNKKIKIGFISNSVTKTHSVSKDRIGVIEYLNNSKDFTVRIITYGKDNEKYYNSFCKNNKDIMIVLDGSINDIPERILEQKFDILVYPEIGLDQMIRYIAHLRLAPIQITTWGNSETSGIDTIDYYISSKYFESPENQSHYTEKLILLDSLGTYYLDNSSSVPYKSAVCGNLKDHLKIPNGATIYGCVQLYHKFQSDTIECINQILEKDQNGYIIFFDNCDDFSESFRQYIFQFIGNDKSDRVRFVGKTDNESFFTYIDICDITLDVITFGGCNTSFDCFGRNKIVITHKTDMLSSSFTTGFYKKMGITEFICNSYQEYIDKAVFYANNKDERTKYEQLIKDKRSLIFKEDASRVEWAATMKNLYANHSN